MSSRVSAAFALRVPSARGSLPPPARPFGAQGDAPGRRSRDHVTGQSQAPVRPEGPAVRGVATDTGPYRSRLPGRVTTGLAARPLDCNASRPPAANLPSQFLIRDGAL